MPNLSRLALFMYVAKLQSAGTGSGVNWDFNFGIEHLSSLSWVGVDMECDGAYGAYVEAVEYAFKGMAEANPNRPTLSMFRLGEWYML